MNVKQLQEGSYTVNLYITCACASTCVCLCVCVVCVVCVCVCVCACGVCGVCGVCVCVCLCVRVFVHVCMCKYMCVCVVCVCVCCVHAAIPFHGNMCYDVMNSCLPTYHKYLSKVTRYCIIKRLARMNILQLYYTSLGQQYFCSILKYVRWIISFVCQPLIFTH